MSDNGIHIGIDRRVARTRMLLADALMSLGAAQDIEAIEVSDIVDEAGIARSTFYAHYAGKDDFLIRSFVNMLAATDAAYKAKYPEHPQVLPSRSLFLHVYGARDFALRLAQSEIFPHQMAAGEMKLREIVEINLGVLKPNWNGEQKREAAAYIAGGFIGLLRWWKQTGLQQSPDEMQAAFARLTKRVLND